MGGLFSWIWGQRTTAVKLENRIKGQYLANQSEYDNMWKKFVEIAQVTEMQAEHFKDVYTDLIADKFERKKMADFDYIRISPSKAATIILWVFSIIMVLIAFYFIFIDSNNYRGW